MLHLLETEYGLLGGDGILRLLVEDVQQLLDEFYPPTERASSGTLVWTCTADEGRKAVPGKPTEEYKATTVQLPFVDHRGIRKNAQSASCPVPNASARPETGTKNAWRDWSKRQRNRAAG